MQAHDQLRRAGLIGSLRGGALTAGLAALVIAALFRADTLATVEMWAHGSAYGYGFLILPVSLYLIHSRRVVLAQTASRPSFWGVLLVGLCCGIWMIGQAASILELRQFAMVGMVQGVVLGLLGGAAYRVILFPMLYMFLMVPTGSMLLDPLQTITTVGAEILLRASGILLFGARHVIETEHAVYLVSPGCAGLNFVLASLALSTVYAVELYRSVFRRVACVAFALALSVLINIVRVFGIIWLAEATNRQIDIVDDHILYGWGVYSVAMFGAMWGGLRLAQPQSLFARSNAAPVVAPDRARGRPGWQGVAILVMLVAVAWAGESRAVIGQTLRLGDHVVLNFPVELDGWRQVSPEPPLATVQGADAFANLAYVKDGRRLELLVSYYWRQGPGRKATALEERTTADGRWALSDRATEIVRIGESSRQVNAALLNRGREQRRVWSYYWVGGHHAASVLSARLLGLAGMVGADGRTAMVVLSGDSGTDSSLDLAEFISMLDGVLASASRIDN